MSDDETREIPRERHPDGFKGVTTGWVSCDQCGGVGLVRSEPSSGSTIYTCPKCKGAKGRVEVMTIWV